MNNNATNYNIKYSNRKTIAIVINDNKEITVKAPFQMKKHEIEDFVQSKSSWINGKITMLNNRKKLKDDTILFKGEEVKVRFYLQKFLKKSFVVMKDKEIIVNAKNKKDAFDILEKFLKEETLKLVIIRVNYFKKYFSNEPQKISVKNVKSRWGSCSYTNNLNFNSKLIMAPLRVLDYVVVHEMCHMVYKNHSKDFYNLVQKIIPDYKKDEIYLKDNGYLLQILHLQPK